VANYQMLEEGPGLATAPLLNRRAVSVDLETAEAADLEQGEWGGLDPTRSGGWIQLGRRDRRVRGGSTGGQSLFGLGVAWFAVPRIEDSFRVADEAKDRARRREAARQALQKSLDPVYNSSAGGAPAGRAGPSRPIPREGGK